MKVGVSALERAFEIAKSGHVATLEELRDALRHEGYGIGQIQGPTLLKQLRATMKEAKERDIAQ